MNRAVEILSIRHGRTALNATGRFLGITDAPLDALGRAQAAGLHQRLRHLPVDVVAASPLSRAWATALRPDCPVRIAPGLREMHLGVLEGLPVREAVAAHPAFFSAWQRDAGAVQVPGGEGLVAVQRRAVETTRRLAQRAPAGGRVLAVSHQLVLASLACALDGAPLSRWTAYRSEHTGGWRVVWDGTRLHLVGRVQPGGA